MSEETRPRKILITLVLVFSAAMGIVCLWQFSRCPFFERLVVDDKAYFERALQIASGHVASQDVFYQDPLYPYFLALIFYVFGPSLLLVRIVQVAMGTVSVLLVYLAARKTMKHPWPEVAALLFALYGGLYFFELLVLKGALIILLSSLILYLCLAVAKHLGRTYFLLGLCLGLLTLLRGNVLPLVPVLAILPLLSERELPMPVRLRHCVLTALGAILCIAPATFMNYRASGQLVLTTAQGGPNFYMGNNADATGTYMDPAFARGNPEFLPGDFRKEAILRTGRGMTLQESSQYWFRSGLDYITGNPADAFKLYLHKAWLFINQRELPNNYDFYMIREFFVPALYIAFIGFGLLWGSAVLGMAIAVGRDRLMLLPAAFVVLYFLSLLPFYIVSRYRLAVAPGLAFFSAIYFKWAWNCWIERYMKKLVLSMIFVIASMVLGLYPPAEAQNGYYFVDLSRAYIDSGRPAEALPWIERSFRQNPSDAKAIAAWEEAAGRLEERDTALMVDLSRRPSLNSLRILTLAERLEQLGNYRDAAEMLERVLSNNPDNFYALQKLAWLYASSPGPADSQKARQYLDRATRLRPDYVNRPGYKRTLEALEAKPNPKPDNP